MNLKNYLKFFFLALFFIPFLAQATEIFSDPSKTIHLNSQTKEFMIRLASNPTTGYAWSLEGYDNHLLKLKSHRYIGTSPHLVGAGGYEQWLFQVNTKQANKLPVVTKIQLLYARPWNKKDNPRKALFTVKIS